MKRTITIDRIVMINASLRPEEADAFRGAVSAELARLLEDRVPFASTATVGSIAVPLPPGRDLAMNVAAAIHDALGKAG
jgi:hypothetical protein